MQSDVQTETEHVQTVYGDVDIETVECASCDQKTLTDDAWIAWMFDPESVPKEEKSDSVVFKSETRCAVHLCDNCVSDPLSITIPVLSVRLSSIGRLNPALPFIFGLSIGFLSVLFMVFLIAT